MGIAWKGLVRVAATLCAVVVLTPLAAKADFRMEKTFRFEPGATFRLDTDSGSVSLTGTSGSEAEVVITSRREDVEERYEFTFDDSGNGLQIRVERRGGLLRSWFSDSGGLHFEVRLPRRANVFVDTSGGRIGLEAVDGEVDLRTSGGSIGVDDVRGDVLADTSGGAIKVSSVEGDVNADTSGGSISIRDVTGEAVADTSGGAISMRDIGGDVVADTSGGSIDIDGAGGRVKADTSGGPVTVVFGPGNDRGGTLSSSGGRVTAVVDPSVSLDIDASTSGGSVRSDVPLTVRGTVSKSEIRGTLNGGGAVLKLRSSGGGIRIESG